MHELLTPIWNSKRETAQRVRQRIEVVMARAIALNWHPGPNPAALADGLKVLLPQKREKAIEHHPALKWEQMPAFYAELRQHFSLSALALEWLVLTATRAGETAGALWAEIDLEAMVWTIGASRMKAGAEHRVPITPRMAEILRFLPRRGAGVFPGLARRDVMHPESLRRCLQRDLGKADLSVHGFRSSFRTWCRDTGQSREFAELQLAHEPGNAVEKAYARSSDALEKRRALMQQWARYLAGEG